MWIIFLVYILNGCKLFPDCISVTFQTGRLHTWLLPPTVHCVPLQNCNWVTSFLAQLTAWEYLSPAFYSYNTHTNVIRSMYGCNKLSVYQDFLLYAYLLILYHTSCLIVTHVWWAYRITCTHQKDWFEWLWVNKFKMFMQIKSHILYLQ